MGCELEVGGLEVESRRESQRTSCLLTLWLFFICACFLGSSRMIHIQRQLTERCLELLALPEGEPAFILDVGCVPREIVVLCCVVDGLASTWKRALLPFFCPPSHLSVHGAALVPIDVDLGSAVRPLPTTGTTGSALTFRVTCLVRMFCVCVCVSKGVRVSV